MSAPMLEVRDLHVSYGGIAAVKGISFEVAVGSSSRNLPLTGRFEVIP